MNECVEEIRCSRCGSEPDIFCGDCCEWHCMKCYSLEIELRLEID